MTNDKMTMSTVERQQQRLDTLVWLRGILPRGSEVTTYTTNVRKSQSGNSTFILLVLAAVPQLDANGQEMSRPIVMNITAQVARVMRERFNKNTFTLSTQNAPGELVAYLSIALHGEPGLLTHHGLS